MLTPVDCQIPMSLHQSTELSSAFPVVVGNTLCVSTGSGDKWKGSGSCQSDTHKISSFLHLLSREDLQGTVFTFDFQLSDNFHLRFFWSNELCLSVSNHIDYTTMSDTERVIQYGHTYLHRYTYTYTTTHPSEFGFKFIFGIETHQFTPLFGFIFGFGKWIWVWTFDPGINPSRTVVYYESLNPSWSLLFIMNR